MTTSFSWLVAISVFAVVTTISLTAALNPAHRLSAVQKIFGRKTCGEGIWVPKKLTTLEKLDQRRDQLHAMQQSMIEYNRKRRDPWYKSIGSGWQDHVKYPRVSKVTSELEMHRQLQWFAKAIDSVLQKNRNQSDDASSSFRREVTNLYGGLITDIQKMMCSMEAVINGSHAIPRDPRQTVFNYVSEAMMRGMIKDFELTLSKNPVLQIARTLFDAFYAYVNSVAALIRARNTALQRALVEREDTRDLQKRKRNSQKKERRDRNRPRNRYSRTQKRDKQRV